MICPHCQTSVEPIIPLTNGGAMRVDRDVYYSLIPYAWRRIRRRGTYYAEACVNGHTVLAHRLLMNPPAGFVVDHINGDGLDNRRENMRVCTQGENARNRVGVGKGSPFKGVSFRDGKWRARITVNRRGIALGRFVTEEDAARAYDVAALAHFGAFAKLNFGPSPEREAA